MNLVVNWHGLKTCESRPAIGAIISNFNCLYDLSEHVTILSKAKYVSRKKSFNMWCDLRDTPLGKAVPSVRLADAVHGF